MVARSIDQMRLHVREATPVVEERRPKIAGRERGVDADGQPTALASGASLQAGGDRFCFLDDAPRGVEEFLAFYGRPGATVGALEERGLQLIFEIAQAPTERRLPNVERLSRLSQTSVLGSSNRPSQISKLDSHCEDPS